MNKENKMMSALIVGAGAVENAWNPVIRALQPYYSEVLDGDKANCIFAHMVYLLRFYATSTAEGSKERLDQCKQFVNEVKKRICFELKEAERQNEIRARRELRFIVENILLVNCKNFMLVNTNWDTVIDRMIHQVPAIKYAEGKWHIYPLHIHGSITKSEMLYLPTEVTKEPYRGHEEDQEIGGIHGSIMRGLEFAHRVIIYGLSLSPLDAELMQTIAAGMDNNTLREIVIIDPSHKIISGRLKILFRVPDAVSIIGYDPTDLETQFNTK